MAALVIAGCLLGVSSRAYAAPSALPHPQLGQVLDVTTMAVTPSPASVPLGASVNFTAVVTDTSTAPILPYGNVTWTDVTAKGTFSADTCALEPIAGSSSQSQCTVVYKPQPIPTDFRVYADYQGDPTHTSASSIVPVIVYIPLETTQVVISKPSTMFTGQTINFTAVLTDTTPQPTPLLGTITWSDGNSGGTFTPASCSVGGDSVAANCTAVYKAPAKPAIVTIVAAYSGDNAHSSSSDSDVLVVEPPTVSMLVSASIVGGSKGAGPATFTYTLSNVTRTLVLTSQKANVSMDTGTIWFVPNQLANSTESESWNLLGGSQGTATYAFGLTSEASAAFVYYHQYVADLGYQVVGGSAGASVPPIVSYTSFGLTKTGGAPGQVWVDVGTHYSFPSKLPGSTSNQRWVTNATSGIASAPFTTGLTYYHQYALSISFSVRNGLVNQAAPYFVAESMGASLNISLASQASNVWLDAGSQYSFTDPLPGGNSTVRWSAGPAATGLVTSSNIAATYYEQYAISVTYDTSDGSVAATTLKGGLSTPAIPSISGVFATQNVSIPLQAQAQHVWFDAGTSYSMQATLLQLPLERWVAAGAVTGVTTAGGTAAQTFYHQYLVKVDYYGGQGPSSPATLAYTSLGAPAAASLSSQGISVWADVGTHPSVPDSLAGERWYSAEPSSGVSRSNMTITFFHQYLINASLGEVGGTLPAQVSITGVSAGQPVSAILGTQAIGVWLDGGTIYSIPRTLLQIPNERWVAAAPMTGTVTTAGTMVQVYYHQVLLNLSSSGAPSGASPAISYVTFGGKAQSTLTTSPSAVWADAGTAFSVQAA
ncbi:MAG TPA: hypothetical protein VLU99_03685, partial [Nitrososphaerales archaeon]|nr:hypothetical protein [Nitrososphaerales archaeon]